LKQRKSVFDANCNCSLSRKEIGVCFFRWVQSSCVWGCGHQNSLRFWGVRN